MELYGTAGIRGNARTRVTPSLAMEVGQAVAADARSQESQPEVVVGRDGRVTGPSLAAALEAGLTSGGAAVERVGVIPTPALAFASRGRWGVMLTASHNPPQDNGIKTFRDGVEYSRDRERAIENRVAAGPEPARWDQWTTGTSGEVLPEYREAVIDYVKHLTDDPVELRIAVDVGNGVGAVGTPAVLHALGGSIVTVNGNIDGTFPGRDSKPTAESLAEFGRFVAEAGAIPEDGEEAGTVGGEFDFAIAHDGDADRIVILDSEGEIVHEDTVLAILAEHYVRQARGNETSDPVVVTTPNASARIDERVQAAGGRVERVALGYLHDGIATVRDEGGTVVFAAEPWKHIHPRFGGWIDGVCSAAVLTQLVEEAPSGLAGLRAPVTERPYRKVNIDCPDDAKPDVMERLHTTLPDAFPEAACDTAHGVRLDLPDDSWVLVRPSGTEPYIRLYAESEDVDTLVNIARQTVERAVDAEVEGAKGP